MKQRITERLSTEFEKSLYKAVTANLNQTSNPLRLNNYAYAMRELTRRVLRRLAPDKMVLETGWYSNKTGKEGKLARSERIQYAIMGGVTLKYVDEKLNIDYSRMEKRLKDSIKILSKYTHIEEETFETSEITVTQTVSSIENAIVSFFELIDECRNQMSDQLCKYIGDAVFNEAIGDVIGEIDELATHYWIDEVWTDEISVDTIDNNSIQFTANGSITCMLQWGSDSDMSNDIGFQQKDSFPFSCIICTSVAHPEDVKVIPETLNVDTDEYFNDEQPSE